MSSYVCWIKEFPKKKIPLWSVITVEAHNPQGAAMTMCGRFRAQVGYLVDSRIRFNVEVILENGKVFRQRFVPKRIPIRSN
jgi:hypothetical protein